MMERKRRQNERAWKQATLRDVKVHAISAGALLLPSFVFGVGVDIRFSIEDGVAFIMDFLAPYIGLHDPSLVAFVLICTMLVPFYRLRHFSSALKNLVAGTILMAVALITGSLGGMLAAEFFAMIAGLSPVIPMQEFLHTFLLIAMAWLSAAFVVTMVLGIGNATVLFHNPECRSNGHL